MPINYAQVNSIAISPDGRTIATGEAFHREKSDKNLVRLWNSDSGREISRYSLQSCGIHAVVYSRDGRSLATCGWGLWGVIRLEPSGYGRVREPVHKGKGLANYINTLVFLPDGTQIITGYPLQVWDVRSLTVVRVFEEPHKRPLAIALSSDGELLVTGGKESDSVVRIWDVKTGKQTREMPEPTGDIYSVDISRDGRFVAACGRDCKVRLWEVETGKLVHEITRRNWFKCVRFAPDGKTFTAGNADGSVRTWFVDSGEQWRVYNKHEGKEPIFSLEYSPDGRFLAWAAGPYLVIHHFDGDKQTIIDRRKFDKKDDESPKDATDADDHEEKPK